MRIIAAILMALFITPATGKTMRIVSAGSSVSEIIYALGYGDSIVATDNTSTYPSALAQRPKLGYFRQLSIEGILAQHPTHLFGAAATGPEAVLEQLQSAGVAVNIYNPPRTLEGLYSMIGDIASDLNAEQQSQSLVNAIAKDVTLIKEKAQQSNIAGLKALYVVANNDRGLTVAGTNTLPDALFSILGLTNVATDIKQYKVMDNESIMLANPDLILMASHFSQTEQPEKALCAHPAIAVTNAGQHCKIQQIASAVSLGLSPRIAEALSSVLTLASQVKE